MSKLNHQRPYLQLLDNFRREHGRLSEFAGSEITGECQIPRKPLPWETIIPPAAPREDGQLSPQHIAALEEILNLNHELILASGLASPIWGKISSKKKIRLATSESRLIDGCFDFLRYCAEMAESDSLEPWHWVQDYCNSHRKNGNHLFDSIAEALMGPALEKFFWWSLQEGSARDKARLVAFVKMVSKQ